MRSAADVENGAVPFLGDVDTDPEFGHLDAASHPVRPENVSLLTAGINTIASAEERNGPGQLSASAGVESERELAESLKSLKDASEQHREASRAASLVASQGGHSEEDMPEVTVRGMIIATLVGGIVGAQVSVLLLIEAA